MSPSVTPAARQHHRDQLARLLRQRPAQRELVERNIIYLKSEQERREDRERIGIKLNRRLSLRPTADELQQKNILHCTSKQLASCMSTVCVAIHLTMHKITLTLIFDFSNSKLARLLVLSNFGFLDVFCCPIRSPYLRQMEGCTDGQTRLVFLLIRIDSHAAVY